MATLKRATKAPARPAGGRKLGASKRPNRAAPAPAKTTAPAKKAAGGGRQLSKSAAAVKSNGPRKAAAPQSTAKAAAPAKKVPAKPVAPARRKRTPTTVTHTVFFDLHCKSDLDAVQIKENLWKWIDHAWQNDLLPNGSGLVKVFLGDDQLDPVVVTSENGALETT